MENVVSQKVCAYCKLQKEISEFPKHSLYKDRMDTRCRVCVKEQYNIRKKLHKIAPPKPEFCQCCGVIPRKWCLDHDHATHAIRGWICDRCNTGIGKLGDTIEGVSNALKYLQK